MTRDLTDGERRVFLAYLEEETHEKAAAKLSISTQTLKNHLGSIYKKTGARKAHSAIYKMATERGCDPLAPLGGATGGPVVISNATITGKHRPTPTSGNTLVQTDDDLAPGSLAGEDSVPDTSNFPPILERDTE